MEKAPTLSFQCPKLWQDMPGSEKTRFCDQCGHSVKNLSLLDGSSGDLVRDFGAEGELSATKEDAIAVVFKAPKSSG
jgi:hypothetical protein